MMAMGPQHYAASEKWEALPSRRGPTQPSSRICQGALSPAGVSTLFSHRRISVRKFCELRARLVPAPHDAIQHFVPAPRPQCQQVIGVVGAVSWGRDICNGRFHYDLLFRIDAVGTENVSYPKPVGFALCLVDRSHRLSKLLFAVHPPGDVLGSVFVSNLELIFITVNVRHLFLTFLVPERH